jgi:methyl-accepting chemotaxis protein
MNDCVTMVDEAVSSLGITMQKMDSVVDRFQLLLNNIISAATSADMQSKNVKSINDSICLLLELSGEEQSSVI